MVYISGYTSVGTKVDVGVLIYLYAIEPTLVPLTPTAIMMTDIREKSELKSIPSTPVATEKSTMDMTTEDSEKQLGIFRKVTNFLLQWGVETHG